MRALCVPALVFGCACNPSLRLGAPAPQPSAGHAEELRAQDPQIAHLVAELERVAADLRALGQHENVQTVESAAVTLIERSRERQTLTAAWSRCTEQQAVLSNTLLSLAQRPSVGQAPTQEQTPAPESVAPGSPKRKKVRPAGGNEVTDKKRLEKRLRDLAQRLEERGRAQNGHAMNAARLENARQLLLDANQSVAKGLLANGARLADRVQAELQPDQAPATRITSDHALKSDAQRVFNDRMTVIETGILVKLADADGVVDKGLLDQVGQLLTVYVQHPARRLGADPAGDTARRLDALLARLSRPAVPDLKPTVPDPDGTWLWIGFSG